MKNKKFVRKVIKNNRSYGVNLPMEIMEELGWRKKQKVVIKQYGKGFVIRDWKK